MSDLLVLPDCLERIEGRSGFLELSLQMFAPPG